MSESFPHMIPATRSDEMLVRRLAGMVGRPGRAVELALDQGILMSPPPDPSFRPETQIHVHLAENYRKRFEPSALGYYLHVGIVHYFARFHDSVTGKRDIDFWTLDQPESEVRAVQRRAFKDGRDVRDQLTEDHRAAIVTLLTDLRPADPEARIRIKEVEVPVDPETRRLYSELVVLANQYGWNPDLLIEKRMSEQIRRRP